MHWFFRRKNVSRELGQERGAEGRRRRSLRSHGRSSAELVAMCPSRNFPLCVFFYLMLAITFYCLIMRFTFNKFHPRVSSLDETRKVTFMSLKYILTFFMTCSDVGRCRIDKKLWQGAHKAVDSFSLAIVLCLFSGRKHRHRATLRTRNFSLLT